MLRRLNVKGIGEWSSYNPENRIMHLNHFLLSCSLSMHVHIACCYTCAAVCQLEGRLRYHTQDILHLL